MPTPTLVRWPLAAVLLLSGAGCSGGGPGSYCDAMRDYAELSSEATFTFEADSSMADAEVGARIDEVRAHMERSIAQLRSLLDRMEETAPQQVRGSVAIAADLDRRYYDHLEEADFDLLALIGALPTPDRAEMDAVEAVDRHARDECGRRFPGVGVNAGHSEITPPTPPTPPAGPSTLEPLPPPAPPPPPEPPSVP